MSDVFDVLKADHERLERTVAQLEDRAPGEGQLAEGLVIENLKHEAAEQIHLWPAVRERLSDGDLLADLGLSQEGDGKRLLADLHRSGPGQPSFEQLVRAFAQAARAHIAFEENQVWPALQVALSEQEADDLGDKIITAKMVPAIFESDPPS